MLLVLCEQMKEPCRKLKIIIKKKLFLKVIFIHRDGKRQMRRWQIRNAFVLVLTSRDQKVAFNFTTGSRWKEGSIEIYYVYILRMGILNTSMHKCLTMTSLLRVRSFGRIRIWICDTRSHRSRCVKGTTFQTSSQRIPKSTLF